MYLCTKCNSMGKYKPALCPLCGASECLIICTTGMSDKDLNTIRTNIDIIIANGKKYKDSKMGDMLSDGKCIGNINKPSQPNEVRRESWKDTLRSMMKGELATRREVRSVHPKRELIIQKEEITDLSILLETRSVEEVMELL